MRSFAGLLSVVAFCGGCSADDVEVSEPTMFTQGAFLAIPRSEGELELDRVLGADELPPQEGVEGIEAIVHLTVYNEVAGSFEAARELAKSHDLTPFAVNQVLLASTLRKLGARVVWYRTLTAEELP